MGAEKLFPVFVEVISDGNEETLRTLCDPPTYSWWRQLRNHCILKREICYGDVKVFLALRNIDMECCWHCYDVIPLCQPIIQFISRIYC